tara:strand:+ start:108 stop:635 length:528 start_codon:yes stop_codon:yes gene_type:complete
LINVLKFLFTYLFISSYNLIYATEIAVLNINEIINNNVNFQELVNKADKNKEDSLNLLQDKRKEINNLKSKIEAEKLILDKNELDMLIFNYNSQIEKFNEEVNSIDIKYNALIKKNENILMNELIKIVKEIAEINKYDLVLSESNYFMVSDSIDISKNIIKKLNDINIVFEYDTN